MLHRNLPSIFAFALACASLPTIGALAQTTTPLVANGSFETNNVGSPTNFLYGNQPPGATPWTFSNNQASGVAGNTSAFGLGTGVTSDGSYFAFVRNSTKYAGGTITQAVNLAPGTYVLTFTDSARSNSDQTGTNANVTFSVSLGALTLTPTTGSATDPTDITAVAGQPFTTETYTFTVMANDPTSDNLTFAGVSSFGSAAAYIDSVAITAVPEPATLLGGALLVGVAGLSLRRRLSV